MLVKPWAALLVCFPLLGGSPLRTDGQRLRVKDGRLLLHVSRYVHFGDGTTGVEPLESAAAVHSAVIHAARAWSRTEKSALSVEVEFTDNTQAGLDGENVVTFNDPAPYDSGLCDRETYVACTLISFTPGSGEILAVSIAFNPYMRHSAAGLPEAHDIGIVMMHEIGHAIGLDHSPVMSSVMAPFVEVAGGKPDGRFVPRVLSRDDILSAAGIYPHPDLVVSRVEGRVHVDEAPAAGVHVLAMDNAGAVVHGTLTGDDGGYTLLLEPGEYRIVAEPLDGPVFPHSFTQPPPATPVFRTVFWPHPVSLLPGETRGDLSFRVASRPSSNLESVGIIEGGTYLGYARILLARGRDYTLGITRTPFEGTPVLEVTHPGVKLAGEPRASTRAPQLVRQQMQIPSDAAPGSWSVVYRDEHGDSLLAGSFVIVQAPEVESVADAVTLAPAESFAAGQLVAIRGREFALVERVAEQVRDEIAWPSQLDGIAVRIGGRFAALRYVSPEEIVAEIPAGLSGDTVDLVVITGPQSESVPVSLKLATP